MSKKHWNTVYLDQLSPKLLTELIDHSYELVVSKFTKKLKAEFEAM
jgi:predicted DNA-binding protein (MmcQ/YjbR family)